MQNNSRCRRVVAVTVAVALALTCTAAAQASPGPARSLKPALLASGHTLVQAKSLPGLRPALDASPIIIPAGDAPSGTSEGELGWLICLYNDQSYCMGDTGDPGDAHPDGSEVVILENISEDLVASTIFYAIVNAKRIYTFVKKFWYKGRHAGFASGDGQCMGDWGYNQDSTLGSCGSAHGIYYQLQSQNPSGSAFRMWDTYAKGDMIAASTTDGTDLFVHSPEDWSTWTGIPVCYINCD